MFGKKKKQALFNAVDDSRIVVNDFQLRTSKTYGTESYRTVEYRLSHKLEESEMLPVLEEHLARLFAGEVDDANGDMLDNFLFGPAREALPDLGRQHYDHADMIRRLIIRKTADREDIRRLRDERQKERDAMQDDYDKICRAQEQCGEGLV